MSRPISKSKAFTMFGHAIDNCELDSDDMSLFDFTLLAIPLIKDVEISRERLERNDWPSTSEKRYEQRTFIRTVAASIEGLCYCARTLLLLLHRAGVLSAPDNGILAILNEERYSLRENGVVKTDNKRRDAPISLIKFTLKYIPTVLKVETPDVKGQHWQNIVWLFAARDHLMHPRKYDDFSVDESKFADVIKAWEWFLKHIEIYTVEDSEMRKYQEDMEKKTVWTHKD